MRIPQSSIQMISRVWYSFLIISLFISINSPCSTSSSTSHVNFGNETDKLALFTLKNHLVDGHDGALRSWNDSVYFCLWQGVACVGLFSNISKIDLACGSRHQRVTSLIFDGESLGGSLHPSIGNLTFLREVQFSNNNLQGTIPTELGHLHRLRRFNLSRNFFEGKIPAELANCSDLRSIELSYNNLTGSLPPNLGSMPKLSELWLAENRLQGEIPSILSNLSSLIALQLSETGLGGSIPDELGQLKALRILQLDGNNLSGIVPSSLSNLTSLSEISLAANNLSGNLISQLGLNFPNLHRLLVGQNQFTGSIPDTLANISKLGVLDLSSNNMGWKVPDNLGFLENLYWVNLGSNNFGSGKSGDLSFINSLTNVSALRILGLSENNFGGRLPTSIANLSTQLTTLTLGTNQIGGSIPRDIGNLVNVNLFGMEGNKINGAIPTSIGELQNLQVFTLSGNDLSGPIPSSLGNLTHLFYLDLSSNHLTGSIPSSFKSLRELQVLHLHLNKLYDRIPANTIGGYARLYSLTLFGNSLNGSLPADVGSLKNLQELYVSDNMLTGEIPRELGNCLALESLSMENNLLEGKIPSSLGSLRTIQYVDLSNNRLSGEIPKELQGLSLLQYLNLSYNQLEGEIPTRGVFANASAISLSGNRKLCGGIPQLQQAKCLMSNPGKQDKPLSVKSIIAISIASGVVFVVLIVLGVLLYLRRKPKQESSSASSSGHGYMRVTYSELVKATDGFSSSKLIGVGSFGSVYKGILHNSEKAFAIKVLDLEKLGVLKSFMAECRALKGIRHRNLIKIVTTCSSVDFKGNDFMALVYDFMPNGSLDFWLHESKKLQFGKRLNIVIDVASALDYLHHQFGTTIVHCDLKPSNVLLDDDMVAHVGDFGLARLLSTSNVSKDQTVSSAIKGTVGYVAPEYGMGGAVSTEGDVYSFGILLLEVVTGKRPTDDVFTDGMNLRDFSKMCFFSGKAREVVDSCLLAEILESAEKEQPEMWECLECMIRIGNACSEEVPNERMDIKDALSELHSIKGKVPDHRPESPPPQFPP